jgi:hypothetical protein
MLLSIQRLSFHFMMQLKKIYCLSCIMMVSKVLTWINCIENWELKNVIVVKKPEKNLCHQHMKDQIES